MNVKEGDTLRHNLKREPQTSYFGLRTPKTTKKTKTTQGVNYLGYKVEKLRFSSYMWFIISDFSSAVRKYGQSEPPNLILRFREPLG